MLEYNWKGIAAKDVLKHFQVSCVCALVIRVSFGLCFSELPMLILAWEKRTDISTAINVATKKRIPKLVQELKVKLDALPQVSHTTVIKAKESHLASKTLKSELHKLANKRLGRAQEVSTERVIAIMSLWARRKWKSCSNGNFRDCAS